MVTVTKTELVVEMYVDFVSCFPYRLVHWRNGDISIQQDERHNLTVTPVRVTSEYQPDVTLEGFRATLRIQDPELQDFGLYRVTVGNSEGISESSVFLDRATSVPTFHSYSLSSQDATITVTFSSDPNFQVEWYKIQRILTAESNVDITTHRDDNALETEATYTTLLKYGTPTEPNYGKYMCVLRNNNGTTEVFIDMGFPETELPHLLETAVQQSDKFIVLTVNFDSNIAYPTATWYHNNDQLGTSDKYATELKWKNISSQDWLLYHYPPVQNSTKFESVVTMNVSTNFRYKYPSIGGSRSFSHPNANYTAVLAIYNLTQEDFGLYKVVLENGAGLSRKVIEVTAPEGIYKACVRKKYMV
ncbi:hypothetical protein KP79_PYT00981 [Mizuhopecten yessoensis]|uniref:Ig-like domain-containing protein n=1 Tax=Mizuhopecten yessoensis TaxID=6573 RepID=A0A210QM94_MIZYE|nr:hypothetical protein KP79_PYT00981 [Mizuhopecten yessoensis]